MSRPQYCPWCGGINTPLKCAPELIPNKDACRECNAYWRSLTLGPALSALARNLAIAAALCEAYELGVFDLDERLDVKVKYGYRPYGGWSPGCGRPAPGSGGEL